MASPTVAARTETSDVANATTHTVNFTQTTGDGVFIVFGQPTTLSISNISDGFTRLTGATATHHILWKASLDGSEGGSMTFDTGSGTRVAAIAYNVQGHDTGITPDFNTSGGTSATPDPPSLTLPSGSKDYLFIAAFRQAGEEADDDTWCNNAPTGYGNLTQTTTGTAGAATANASEASADRAATTAGPEDPSTFGTDQSLAWSAITAAIHPAAPAVDVVRELLRPKVVNQAVNRAMTYCRRHRFFEPDRRILVPAR